MAIYKRGAVYWYEFVFGGRRHRGSTKTSNARAARAIEAAAKVALAEGRAGLSRAEPAPTLAEFLRGRLADYHAARFAGRAPTLRYYSEKSLRLARGRLGALRLDAIGAEQVAAYSLELRREGLGVNATNHLLAVLRRALRLAGEWGLVARVPPVPQLRGGGGRKAVLPREREADYLAALRPDHALCAEFILRSGLRPSEALGLRWDQLDLDPGDGGAGWATVANKGRGDKLVPLTRAARAVLDRTPRLGPYCWAGDRALSQQVMIRAHRSACRAVGLPDDLALHGLRHTAATRMGEAGLDAFVLSAILGHSKITTTQRYVHPQRQAMAQAAARMDRADQEARVPTKSPTGAVVDIRRGKQDAG